MHWRKRRRRQRLSAAPVPPEWIDTLIQNVPLYQRLPSELKSQLHGRIQVFLDEKHFEGALGLIITDEIRVTIAAQACLLILNRPTNYFRGLSSIVVYPSQFIAPRVHSQESGTMAESDEVCLGESWQSGTVVLAWDLVQHGAWDTQDGQNVTLHEFAHQLDQEDHDANGAPVLSSREHCASWARVLSHEFKMLQRRTRKGRLSVIDEYGATHPAEFFASATEAFFEKSQLMKKKHPELYAELQKYYQLDPASWR